MSDERTHMGVSPNAELVAPAPTADIYQSSTLMLDGASMGGGEDDGHTSVNGETDKGGFPHGTSCHKHVFGDSFSLVRSLAALMSVLMEDVPLGTGPPTKAELIKYYPAKFSWTQLRAFINAGDLGLLKRDKALQKR
jgi:hypothetical protein